MARIFLTIATILYSGTILLSYEMLQIKSSCSCTEVFFKKDVFKNFRLKTSSFIKKTLQGKCFPMNFVTF